MASADISFLMKGWLTFFFFAYQDAMGMGSISSHYFHILSLHSIELKYEDVGTIH